MSFLEYKDLIEEGDTVIIYLNHTTLYAIEITNGKVFQTKYGALKHDDLLGQEYGTLVKCTRGYVHVLHPTPELWTLTLPHRTQIIYTPDISMIVMQLDLKPGCVVCESGTGSGSLSHALIRAIAPYGHLYTYDFHEFRVQAVKEEFAKHKLQNLVTVKHRDVAELGFEEEASADGIFLDLPHPWKVVDKAVQSLKKNKLARLVSFSPCIEQVQRTAEAMRSSGFTEVSTIECLSRPYDVRNISLPILKNDINGIAGCEPASEDENPYSNSFKKRSFNASASLSVSGTEWMAVPSAQAPGHTGYLTFGTYSNFK